MRKAEGPYLLGFERKISRIKRRLLIRGASLPVLRPSET